MLLDANLLLFAVDADSPFHERAAEWLTAQLGGARRVGFPWQTLGAFIRISTHPPASARPLEAAAAWRHVDEWLSCSVAWVPLPGPGYRTQLGGLITRHRIGGNLVTDAHLAALAIENNARLGTFDNDFEQCAGLDLELLVCD
jgi:toxin-antitoxin system PIN domain toxin